MSYKRLFFFFAVVFFISHNYCNAQNLDIEILRSIHVDRCQSLDPGFKLISKTATPVSLGLPLTYLVLGVLIAIKHSSIWRGKLVLQLLQQ
jgi:hypothetical protein